MLILQRGYAAVAAYHLRAKSGFNYTRRRIWVEHSNAHSKDAINHLDLMQLDIDIKKHINDPKCYQCEDDYCPYGSIFYIPCIHNFTKIITKEKNN